ncbi:carboxypeptidase-like regulatory domain-containing protein [Pinibacter aurantiacus]|uniref:Carboxypeptidase-like regulatory domain-containing protein n=1 Tax=Pinibacter aurantiacus TaxID=2851599 RepID=A0A9E2SEN9_9BACT|nr:carboxypeptidase-like regulatory domain-containing protein [Pinibacter aurantiacus]MBV4359270.1 carboxypeptidase-like regulatory domain-containing protein [Pinibacter aurantiacus]
MKNLLKALLLLAIVFNTGCRKNDQPSVKEPDPITPDLISKISTSISGYVMNESGKPVAMATVSVGSSQMLTDEYGYFSLSNTEVPAAAGVVKVYCKGYFMGYKTFVPEKNKSGFVRMQLLTKSETGVVSAASGGEIATNDGGKIILPANGVVAAATSSAYTGQVHVSIKNIDPSATENFQAGMPGDGRATDSVGHLKALRSYGAVAVELTGDNGQALQIAQGKTASIFIPISSSLAASAPESITLWSFNEGTGLWKQEGTAVKKDNTYCGTTSHFSFWAGAAGVPLVNFKARVVDASLNPLSHVPVSVTVAGMPLNAGYGRFGYTDADGNISGAVFANSNLILQVLTPCAIAAYAQNFTTTSTDIDLGQVTGNIGQSVVTISGSVNNCASKPVQNGYVQTYDHGFYNRIPVVNGAFSFTGIACSNLSVNVVAVDNATNLQGTPQVITITAGTNNLGTLTACGTSTMGNITYTIDGVTTSLTEPADTVGGYYLTMTPDTSTNIRTQIVTLSRNVNNNPQISFQFDGNKTIGSTHYLTEVFSPAFTSGRGYWPVQIPLTITEFGEIGGFISGSFSSKLIEFDNSAVHDFSCSFRIRRYN